jgi:xanthine dehydrogenase small subunit
MNTRPIRFFHQGAIVQVDAAEPTRTVLQWLREDARCTGTKEGCAEGDCGACTVVLGELDAQGGLALKPVNACIQFLPTLDGKALFTVQDLSAPGRPLHPVQQSLVDCHGSQCGFCTPGFVMSLWASYQQHQAAGTLPSRQDLADDLSGNLCRCTGYRPILDAGQRMFEAPPAPLDTAPVAAALRALQADPPLHRAGFHAPRTLADFAALRQALPQARVLAGSTDMGLWVTKQLRDPGELISITAVAELKRIEHTAAHICIGAAASLQDAWSALAAEWPALREVMLRFASLPVRRSGTMGGNLANGSPIGDSAPVLMALDAVLLLRRGDSVRRLPLHGFYTGYMQNQLQPGEFVQAIEVPRAATLGRSVRAYKISKRFDCDISALCAGLSIRLQGEHIADVRLAYGGMAATVLRAAGAEAALVGQPWSEASLQSAMVALAQDFTPLTDMRASSGYRLQVAQNLLRRFWLETRPANPLPASATSVWSRAEPA